MNNIAEKIERINSNLKELFVQDIKYNEFKDYYQEMMKKGLIIPQKYNIPPLDTVGRRLYQSK